ncbi:MAG: hypothetical protein Fur0024_2330 [Patescibacteria group bacterium]
MKIAIHPAYKQVVFTCSCGTSFTTGSTSKDDTVRVEICSNCHPFYTNKQKLIDTEGVVNRFNDKLKKSQIAQEKQAELMAKREQKQSEKIRKRQEKLAKEVGIKDISKILSSSNNVQNTTSVKKD